MKITKYLKVAVFVYLLSLLMVACQSVPRNLNMDASSVLQYRHRSYSNIDWSTVEITYVRIIQLYSACSQHRLQITSRRSVNAQGLQDSPIARLRVETIKQGSKVLGLRISSGYYNTYLCFNKNGRLTVKYKGSSLNCLFREKFSGDFYTRYQSLHNKTWFIGFNRNGKPLAGEEQVDTRRPRCFKFIKYLKDPKTPSLSNSGFQPFSPEAMDHLLLIGNTKLKSSNAKRLQTKRRRKFATKRVRLRHHRRKKRLQRRRHRKPPPR